MHAVVVRVKLNDPNSAREMVTSTVVPRVSSSPGFVSGHWTWDSAQSNGLSMVIFDSEANAQATADRVAEMITDAISLESVEVREVVASA